MIIKYLTRYFPDLKRKLKTAHMQVDQEAFLKKTLIKSSGYALMLGFLFFMLADQKKWPLSLVFLMFIIIFYVAFYFGIKKPDIVARARGVDIDREVLFAGRFILIKLHSGKPLVNALMEAANSYGVAHKYFEEIVRDIELGTTLEDAIENAMNYSPSDNFRKILFQIHNALRLGIDVTKSLEAVLEEITQAQLLAITRYGKKLSSVTLFYMLLAIVFPSLGMTILTVIISFAGITMDMLRYIVVIFLLAVIQFMFITVFKGIRPKVNI